MGGRGSAGKKPSGGGGGVMRGSEKQLAWANDIISSVEYTLNEVEKVYLMCQMRLKKSTET